MNLNFPCKKCGMCCRMLKHVPQLHDFDKGDGVCKYLENNLCSIYDKRPLICNVQKMYEKFFANIMPPEEFIFLNLEACQKLMHYTEKI
ncbi:MAG: YkgJ family cysteine cluster protein [Synergistaceae bacterium]|nr:YkgJ family cysteine cluster protein [Synergistaceae bacterium]MBQ7068387.1 YkgJ family cysteine cluster protein [Synergistaceae bacterium]